MIRARFHANADDFRSINWPVKHPYWCSGYGDNYSVVVAYADNEEEILKNWPEATEIESTEVDSYVFSDRFPKPDWLTETKP
jgi:hypothetical protein